MKNTSLFTYSANILVVANRKCEELSHPRKSENMRPHSSDSIENATPLYSQSSRENKTPSSGTHSH